MLFVSSESIAILTEPLFRYRTYHLCHRLLYDSVYHCRYSKTSYSLIRFRYFHSPYRLRFLFPFSYSVSDLHPVRFQIAVNFLYRDSVCSACTSRYNPWESLLGSSATTPLMGFHHRLMACPSYLKNTARFCPAVYMIFLALLFIFDRCLGF